MRTRTLQYPGWFVSDVEPCACPLGKGLLCEIPITRILVVVDEQPATALANALLTIILTPLFVSKQDRNPTGVSHTKKTRPPKLEERADFFSNGQNLSSRRLF